MKKYALFVINFPDDYSEKMRIASVTPFLKDTPERSREPIRYPFLLGEGTFLLEIERDLPALGELIHFCEHGYRNSAGDFYQVPSYKVLFFDTENEWIEKIIKIKDRD